MKIAYILGTFPAASETFARREIDSLGEMGWDVRPFVARRSAETRDAATAAVCRPGVLSVEAVRAVAHLLWRHPLGVVRWLCLLIEILRECPRDALVLCRNIHTVAHFVRAMDRDGIGHVHAYFLSWPALIGVAVARVTRRSFSMAAHARDLFVESGALKAKARTARLIVTCTRQGADHLAAVLPGEQVEKVHLVRHGIADVGRAGGERPDQRRRVEGTETILAVGRLVAKKGFAVLVQAFGLIATERRGLRLVIVGDGPQRAALAETARSLGIDDRFDMPGWLPHAEVLTRMDSAAMIVAPSVIAPDGDRDGVPNVLLEAGTRGLPVVASRLDGIAEIVADGETGLLVAPGDVRELADAIKRLLADASLREHLARGAQAHLRRHYDLGRNVARIDHLLRKASA